jgi:hypothetical protein
MTTLHFQCELLADIILNASSATAQSVDTLEYIPAAKFMGIVAKALYKTDGDKNNDKNKAIFHSGKVRFGDAHIMQDGLRSLKMPFDFMTAKKLLPEDKNKIWVNHFLNEIVRTDLVSQGIQLQQKRIGFFIFKEDLAIETVDNPSSYSLKSAYNADERRTKDQQMFGYNALKKGSIWAFSVDIDADLKGFEEEIKAALIGQHSLGKSRSAQYGRVQISEKPAPIPFSKQAKKEIHKLVLYAESNCCFLDDYGQYTVKPTIKQLFGKAEFADAENMKIDWAQSQIRQRVYAPWNIQRACRDADRWLIEKGSVLVINYIDGKGNIANKISENIPQIEKILAQGVGEFRVEGYGKFLVNPDFLCENEILTSKEKSKEADKKSAPKIIAHAISSDAKMPFIKTMLANRKGKLTAAQNIANDLMENIAKHSTIFKGITASQWGQVRAYAQNIKDWPTLEKLLFDDKFGFLYTGKRKDFWLKSAITELKEIGKGKIKDEIKADGVSRLLVFASEMAKIAQQPQEN